MYIVLANNSEQKVAAYGPFRSELAAERWARERRRHTYKGEHWDFLAMPIFQAHERPALAAIALEMQASSERDEDDNPLDSRGG